MARQIEPGGPEWTALFTGFRRSAFRLEALQDYRDSVQGMAQWERGEPIDYPGKRDWTDLVAAAGRRGAVVSRVHVITEPVTGYIRYELAAYAANVAAGEQVGIIPVRAGWPAGVPRRDFWLFDSRAVVWMDYDRYGALTSATITRSPATAVFTAMSARNAVAASVPYRQYMQQAGTTASRT